MDANEHSKPQPQPQRQPRLPHVTRLKLLVMSLSNSLNIRLDSLTAPAPAVKLVNSAGGNIAHHVTVRALQSLHEFGRIKLGGLIGVQPFFGGEERTESELRLRSGPFIDTERTDVMWRNFLPEGADRNHPAAHVFGTGIAKSLDFPRMLVIAGGFDPLRDWDRRYVEDLRSCGKEVELVKYPNAFHGFYGFPELSEFVCFSRTSRGLSENRRIVPVHKSSSSAKVSYREYYPTSLT